MRVTNNQQIKDLFKDSKVSLPIEKLDRIDKKLDKIIVKLNTPDNGGDSG